MMRGGKGCDQAADVALFTLPLPLGTVSQLIPTGSVHTLLDAGPSSPADPP